MRNQFYKLNSPQRMALWCSGVLLVAITLASLIPAHDLPRVSGGDKLHHFFAYLAVILPIAVTNLWLALRLAPLALLYSGIIELVQPLTNRYAEWADFFVNGAGILCGVGVGVILSLIQHRRSKR